MLCFPPDRLDYSERAPVDRNNSSGDSVTSVSLNEKCDFWAKDSTNSSLEMSQTALELAVTDVDSIMSRAALLFAHLVASSLCPLAQSLPF